MRTSPRSMRVPASSTTSIVLSAGSSFSVNHTCSSVGTAAAIMTPPTAGLARLTRACAAPSTGRAESTAISSKRHRAWLPAAYMPHQLVPKNCTYLAATRAGPQGGTRPLRVPELDLAHSGNEDEEHCPDLRRRAPNREGISEKTHDLHLQDGVGHPCRHCNWGGTLRRCLRPG